MRQATVIVGVLQAQLAKVERLKRLALEKQTWRALRAYQKAYEDLEITARNLVNELDIEKVDLELMQVKDWKGR